MSDLQKLFDTDPLSLTKSDIDSIITAFRQARANFNLTGTGAKKAAKPKGEKVESIDLDELMGGTPNGS